MKTVSTRLNVAEVFRETKKALGFRFPKGNGIVEIVYIPKSQSRVLPNGCVYVTPWLRRAVAERQGMTL